MLQRVIIIGVDLKDLFTTDRLLQPVVILHPLLDSIDVLLVCLCTQSRLFYFLCLPAKKRQHPYRVLCIMIIVVVLMIGLVWQMSICHPSMNVDSDITTSEKVNKVKPAAFDKPLYEFDRNQAGLMIYISESTIIYTALVVLLVYLMYINNHIPD